jgi:hypothetical protein
MAGSTANLLCNMYRYTLPPEARNPPQMGALLW